MISNKNSSCLLSVLLALLSTLTFARHPELTPPEPPPIGNFSLPAAQEPGPFISFGENIIEKNELQLFLSPSYEKNQQEYFWQVTQELLYGLSDRASILLSLPVAVRYQSEGMRSSGFGDLGLQGEYAIYEQADLKKETQATLVGAVIFPTGSNSKIPPTGNGSPGIFAGATFNQTFVNWLWFASPALIYVVPKGNNQVGTQYLYQMGIGRIISAKSGQYIFSSLLECNGEYTEKDKIGGVPDPNSGGNIILLTPSLWYSNTHLTLQLGVSLPVSQRLNGEQNQNDYTLTATVAWLFS
ncbi:hypothetical protein [Legionella londiniensis]|uniref:hypothetical protein n=1 Tax=Legionella londiniensis TaxID=45068 RepID=UPI00399D47BF